jgi:hypothetical protein
MTDSKRIVVNRHDAAIVIRQSGRVEASLPKAESYPNGSPGLRVAVVMWLFADKNRAMYEELETKFSSMCDMVGPSSPSEVQ